MPPKQKGSGNKKLDQKKVRESAGLWLWCCRVTAVGRSIDQGRQVPRPVGSQPHAPTRKPPQAEKIIEDKTFGLKNKNKSKKVQQYVQTVTAQTKHNVSRRPFPQCAQLTCTLY